MKTAKANSGAYCSMAAIRYAKVLYDMGLPEEVIGEAEEMLCRLSSLFPFWRVPS